jgi:hypothetical protein
LSGPLPALLPERKPSEDERNREKRPAQQAGPKLCGRSEVSHGTLLRAESGEAGALRDSPGILAGRCRPRNVTNAHNARFRREKPRSGIPHCLPGR